MHRSKYGVNPSFDHDHVLISQHRVRSQGCMYRAMPAQQRADCLKALDYQLDALEMLADAEGPWLAGSLSGADAAVRRTLFWDHLTTI